MSCCCMPGSMLVLVALASCTTSHLPAPNDPALPKLRDITSNSRAPDEPPTAAGEARLLARVDTVTLPLATTLEGAWSLLNTQAIPAVNVALWRKNGMLLGLLDPSQASAFRRALGPINHVRSSIMVASEHLTPQILAPPLGRSFTIDLVDAATTTKFTLKRGQPQLLMRLRGNEDTALEVVPHHHRRRVTIKPRTPLETVLDGFQFAHLKIVLHDPRHLLVMGLYRPAQPPSDPSSPAPAAQGEQPAVSTEVRKERQDRPPAEPEIPAHLGRAMFTASRMGRAVQMVVVIEVIGR